MKPFALAVIAAVTLIACGRVGPPVPPGPREALTYPRGYPAPTPEERVAINARRAELGLPPLSLR